MIFVLTFHPYEENWWIHFFSVEVLLNHKWTIWENEPCSTIIPVHDTFKYNKDFQKLPCLFNFLGDSEFRSESNPANKAENTGRIYYQKLVAIKKCIQSDDLDNFPSGWLHHFGNKCENGS